MSRKGMSAERIARGILEEKGFNILEVNPKILVDGVEIGEIDLIVQDDNDIYAVEVKAGRADVGSVRQIYANAKLLGRKPLLVCKGFTNNAAMTIAGELGVNMIEIGEFYLLLEPEELEIIVRKAMRDVLEEYGFIPIPVEAPSEEDKKILKALATSSTGQQAALSLGISEHELGVRIGMLKEAGYLIPAGNYESLRKTSARLLRRYERDSLFRPG